MSSIPKTRIRIQADLFSFNAFRDVLRDDEDYRPKFRAGDDVQFEIAFFDNGSLLDVSDIASVTLEIKPLDKELLERYEDDDDFDNYDLRGPDLNLTPIRSKTLAYSALNPSLSQTDWDSGKAQHAHALICIDTRESNIAAGDRWLTISIVTTDTPSQVRTVCAGPIRVLGGGLSQTESPVTETPESYYTADEADARFMRMSANLADLRDTEEARNNLHLGDADAPEFAGLTIAPGSNIKLNGNRLTGVGNASAATDALNRQSGDARYPLKAETYSKPQVAALAAKPFPPALYFNGVSSSGELARPIEVGAGDWTLYASVIADGEKSDPMAIVGGTYSSNGLTVDYNPSTGLWRIYSLGVGSALSLGTYSLTPGQTYKVVVRKQSDVTSLWVDGVTIESVTDTLDYGPITHLMARSELGDTRLEWSGYFCELAFFSYALPDAEISARFSYSPTAPVTSPAAGLGRTDDLMATFTDWDDTGYAFDSFAQSGMNGFTASASGSARCWAATGQSVQAGYTVRVAFDVVTTGTTFDTTVLSTPPASGSNAVVESLAIVDAPAGCVLVNAGIRMPGGTTGSIVLEMILNETTPNLSYRFVTGGESTITVDNFTITSPGLLAHYSASQSTRAGDQLHDLSGIANDALITDGTFTEPTASDFYRARAVDASSALYLGRAGDILPANAVVTSIIVEGTVYPISTTQPTDRRRIRLVPNGADLDVQSSDGTSHTTLVSAATVGDLSAVNLIINYQLY